MTRTARWSREATRAVRRIGAVVVLMASALALGACAAGQRPASGGVATREQGAPRSEHDRSATHLVNSRSSVVAAAMDRPRAGVVPARTPHDAREPSVDQVVAATLRAGAAPRADALASRARTAGWVPTVGLKARRGQGVDLASSSDASDALRLSTDDTLTLEAALTFELDRVVFAREEVALAREARAERDAAQARVREVIALYFERRRLQLEAERSVEPDVARQVRIAELEALLDVFTAGAFGRMIQGSDSS